MRDRRNDSDEERRRLFRRMEWVFVWAPPLLALFVGVFGGAFLAWLLPIGGTTYTQRWIAASVLLLGGTGLVYLVAQWWGGRRG
jgi:hypothetical protein